MGSANRVAKNTMILYARMGITMFISLYATRLVLAALGAADFGIFSVVGGAVAMLTFLNAAMAQATQRFMSYAQGEGDVNKQKSIFNVSFLLHLIIGFILVVVLEVAGYFLFNGILKIDPDRMDVAKLVFHFLVASTFVKVISVPYDAVINAHENMMFVAILGILEAVLKLSIALFVTYTLFDKLISYGLLTAGLAILLLLITRVYCHQKYSEVTVKIKRYYDKALFKEMTSFGGWSFLGSAVSMLSTYGQGIVINMFFGTVVNAAQGVANQINGQLGAFSRMMLKALNPVIVKNEGAGNRDMMLRASMTGSKISYSLLAVFSIPFIIEMPYILNLWLKDVPEFAVIFCRLLLIKNLVEQLFITLSVSISATGKIKNYQIAISLLAILPLLVSYYMFKLGYPPQTIYLLFILQVFIRSFGIVLYYAKKLCGLNIPLFLKEVLVRSTLVTLLSSLPALVLFFYLEENYIRLFLIFSSNIVIYITSFYFIGLNYQEKSVFKSGISLMKAKINTFRNK